MGLVRQAGQGRTAGEATTLHDFQPDDADMFTIVMLVGNSQSHNWQNTFITRGY